MGFVAGAVAVGLVVPYVRTAPVSTTALGASGPRVAATGSVEDGSAGTAAVDPATGQPVAGGAAEAVAGPADDAGVAGGGEAAAGPVVGVTDTEIKIGVGIVDVGQAQQLGATFDLGDQKARWEALMQGVNDAGGIYGRKIVADYRTIEVVNAPVETAQAACVAWVEDVGVFAAFVNSQLAAAAMVCLTGPGHTLTFTSDGFEEAYYGSNLLFTTYASENKLIRDHALYLESRGKLASKTIGILTGEGAERMAVDNTLLPLLHQMGYEVARIESIPSTTAATQRIPVAVSNFKAAGVDFIIMASNIILAGPFAQSAERSNYRPEFAISDFNRQINDQMAQYYPDSFDGTVALSVSRFPEYREGAPFAPADQRCLDRVHPVDPKVLPPTASAFEVAMFECAMFDMFVAAATAAGPDLSQASFLAAADQLGPIQVAGSLDGTIGPGKHHANDQEREVAWRLSCKCWRLVDGVNTPVRRIE
jgi:hypothetical protein